jgi:hypothetical protein
MADETTIRPALTAEEWKRSLVNHATLRREGIEGNVEYGFRGRLSIGNQHSSGSAPPEWNHVIAALALHGQPFGFTREELDAIEDAAQWTWIFGAVKCGHLASAAAKLAALLPRARPETP